MRLMSAMLLLLVLSACKPGDDDGSENRPLMMKPATMSRVFYWLVHAARPDAPAPRAQLDRSQSWSANRYYGMVSAEKWST